MSTTTQTTTVRRSTATLEDFIFTGMVSFIELTLEEDDTAETVADRIHAQRNSGLGLADQLAGETSVFGADEIRDAVYMLSPADVREAANEVLS